VVLPQFRQFAAEELDPDKSDHAPRPEFVSRRRRPYICASTGG
jgi:hypothetical protein